MRNYQKGNNADINAGVVQVLVSTMNQESPTKLVQNMRINKYVIINQITKNINTPKNNSSNKNRILSLNERGLSRSRNKAILNSSAEICVIADDDMDYVDDYETIVLKGFNKYPEADIIAFYVDSDDERQKKEKLKEGQLNLLMTMKIASWNIAFRRKSIIDSGIVFDENFGTGTENYMGEENIFLFDCHNKGLKIYYIPLKIATLRNSQSTWFNGYDKKYFSVKGKVFYRMSPILSLVLILQFAFRKRYIYRHSISTWNAIKCMVSGAYINNVSDRS